LENSVTIRSTRAARMYGRGDLACLASISYTPLLMVVALSDTRTVTDIAIDASARARAAERLQLISGGHFRSYLDSFRSR